MYSFPSREYLGEIARKIKGCQASAKKPTCIHVEHPYSSVSDRFSAATAWPARYITWYF